MTSWLVAVALSVGVGAAPAQARDTATTLAALELRQFPTLEQSLRAIQADVEIGQISQDAAAAELRSLLQDSTLTVPVLADLSVYVQGRSDSYVLSLFMGMFYSAYAWRMRGIKMGHQTSDHQQAEFTSYLRKAEKILRSAVMLDKSPFLAYTELLAVDMGLGNAELASDYERAVALSPESFVARSRYMEALAPKWRGSLNKLHDLVARVQAESIPEVLKKRVASRALALEAEQYNIETHRQRAVSFYELAFDAYPDASNLSPLRQAIKLSNEEGSFADAVRLCGKGLGVAPADRALLNERGYLYETQLDQLALAVTDYEASSARNDPWATGRLGYLYLTGKGVVKDVLLAELLLNKAAIGGDKRAAAELRTLRKQTRGASPASSTPELSSTPGSGERR